MKFCMKVSQTEPIKKLQAFAEANQQTQGKFTIGDEKVCSWNRSLESLGLTQAAASQRIHACPCRFIPYFSPTAAHTDTGPRDPKGHW